MPEQADAEATDSPENIEKGRLLFAQACDFIAGARIESQLPEPTLTEVAFAGRSNVGKSSLLNALTGRRALARTSNTPGRTREVNFFNLGGRLMLVDLPGYGYARASKEEIARWNQLIQDYLKGRANLRRVCFLIDSRHGIKPPDRPVMDLLDEAAVNYQVILTKTDKPKAPALAKVLSEVQSELNKRPAAHPEIIITSAAKSTGIGQLRAALAMLADQ